MATCTFCNLEMSGDHPAADCTANRKILDRATGKEHDSIPFKADDQGMPGDPTERCHDCNVLADGYHHPGCDMERCPICGGQIISCNCDVADAEVKATCHKILADATANQPPPLPILPLN